MVTRDESVDLMHTNARLTKIKKNHPGIESKEIYFDKNCFIKIILQK